MKKFLTIAAATLFAMSVAACNTIRGAGQDVEDAGETIQDAAD